MSCSSQPVTNVGRSLRGLRVIWHVAAMVAAALVFQLPLAASAEAGPRLSSTVQQGKRPSVQ